jgi:beta-carotene 3-hydroxylase
MANVVYALLAYFFMEFVAWFSHKYIMHGFLWSFHRDHHIIPPQKDTFFQKNDLFFLIYAFPAMILIIAGFAYAVTPFLAIGAGITLYGLTYFLIHDVLIHRRIPLKIKITGGYFAALVRAHEAHHTGKNVKDFNNYGLLIFNPRYFRK